MKSKIKLVMSILVVYMFAMGGSIAKADDLGIKLDGDMLDWTSIPYMTDVDKYGVHTEDITGASYYIDKKENYMYLKVGLKDTRVKHLRVWCVKNKDVFDEFLRRYNTGGGLETGLISTLENATDGVISFSANIEKLTQGEKTRVQVLNHKTNAFKEEGYWVDEATNTIEFRIPLDQVTDSDGSHNFNLILGTDLFNWPTADFLMVSISSGSTGALLLVGLVVGVVGFITIKRKSK